MDELGPSYRSGGAGFRCDLGPIRSVLGSANQRWSSKSGTSIAAAHVAGAVAALRSAVPDATTADMFNALYDSGGKITHAAVTRPIIDIDEALKLLGGPAAKAEILTPAPGSQLEGSPITFTWSPGNHVTEYGLRVGTTGPGSGNIFYQLVGTNTSQQVSNLPTDGTVNVRLFSRIGGQLQHIDYTYTGGEKPRRHGVAHAGNRPTGNASSIYVD